MLFARSGGTIHQEEVMPKCNECGDSGVIETGNNDLPCDCPAGSTALFNTCGVQGPVTGAHIRRHHLNCSPEPIRPGPAPVLVPASASPLRAVAIRTVMSAGHVVWIPHCKVCGKAQLTKETDDRWRCKECGQLYE